MESNRKFGTFVDLLRDDKKKIEIPWGMAIKLSINPAIVCTTLIPHSTPSSTADRAPAPLLALPTAPTPATPHSHSHSQLPRHVTQYAVRCRAKAKHKGKKLRNPTLLVVLYSLMFCGPGPRPER